MVKKKGRKSFFRHGAITSCSFALAAGLWTGVAEDLFSGGTPAAGYELPVVQGKGQLVENPMLAPGKDELTAGLIPSGWSVSGNRDWVKMDANGLACTTGKEGFVSITANLRREQIVPGRVYQIGISYRLKKNGGQALLRFRNEIDRGSFEFELPEGDWQRKFFYAVGPEDYDVGLYYLEVMLQGAGTDFALRGISCREATQAEALAEKVTVLPNAVAGRGTAAADERWIEELPGDVRFMDPAERTAAWAPGEEGGVIRETLAAAGDSFWFDHSAQAFWKQLSNLKSKVPRLSVSLPPSTEYATIPGGYGLDPLPARSAHAAALLFGIGAVDSGVGSFQFKRLHELLERAGYFDKTTVFLPFWQHKGFYKARYESRDNPVDFRAFFKDQPDAPLFGHTAPGVLVSGYQNGDKLLLVVVNTSRQSPGKLGHLWVDHARVFGLPPDGIGDRMRDAKKLGAIDLETNARGATFWDRISGGFVSDYWFNVAIPPGDYRLILVENKK